MGMLEQAAAWLEHQRQRNLAVPAAYRRRSGETFAVHASPGRTLFRAENEYGATIRTESRDFLIAADELPFDPARGDRIECGGREYEVLAPNGEGVWRWCGGFHWTKRIHTKELGGA